MVLGALKPACSVSSRPANGSLCVKQQDALELTFVDTKTSETHVEVNLSAKTCRLLVVHGLSPCALPLHDAAAMIGRSPASGATLILRHATVSRRHLVIGWDGAAHTVTDLGSHNGSYLGEIRLEKDVAVPLRHGHVLRCGDVVLVYESLILDTSDPSEMKVNIPGRSLAAAVLRADINRIAADPACALIMGETGTGKEFVAREIHRLSGRKGAFVALNCAALSPQLVESQLFGHVRGAFTGATTAGEGLFRAASGGTIFFDEIGELPLELQPKLLRALQERRVRPVGGPRELPVDVRVLAATNVDLEKQVAVDRFRRDLYARLRMHELWVPALRERPSDIIGWIEILTSKWLRERDRSEASTLAFTPAGAVAALTQDWLDNLRGLDHLVHRYAHLTRPITAVDVAAIQPARSAETAPTVAQAAPAPTTPAGPAMPSSRVRRRRDSPTKEALLAVLKDTGSVRGTARHFERDRRQIYRWMTAYGIDEQDY